MGPVHCCQDMLDALDIPHRVDTHPGTDAGWRPLEIDNMEEFRILIDK